MEARQLSLFEYNRPDLVEVYEHIVQLRKEVGELSDKLTRINKSLHAKDKVREEQVNQLHKYQEELMRISFRMAAK